MHNNARLNRLFAEDGRCFVVALDQGTVNEARYLPGVEDLPGAIARVAAANPDALLLAPGFAPALQDLAGRTKPSLVLRVDVPNVYHDTALPCLFDELIDAPVEQALRLDAVCVIANLFFIADRPEVYQQGLRNLTRLKAECERYGMPLMIEARVMERDARGAYAPSGDVNGLVSLIRQTFELGADIVKADPTDDVQDFHRVIEVAGGRPVLALGGGKVAAGDILERTAALLQQGARGVVYGRNVVADPQPAAMTRAVLAIVHAGATPQQALRLLRGNKKNEPARH